MFPFQHWLTAEVKWLRQFLISCCIFLSGQNRWGWALPLLPCLTEGSLWTQLLEARGYWDSNTSLLLLLKWASSTFGVTRSLLGKDAVNADTSSIFFFQAPDFGAPLGDMEAIAAPCLRKAVPGSHLRLLTAAGACRGETWPRSLDFVGLQKKQMLQGNIYYSRIT